MKLLIIRNDKLGDFVLTLPCYALLKKALPTAEITVLVPEYTADVARLCPSIDNILLESDDKSFSGAFALVEKIRREKFDSVITLFSTTRTGFAVFLARIKYRLAPATKIAQIFYNNRLVQKRSRSEKPESEYNLDLVKRFLSDHNISQYPAVSPPFISFEKEIISERYSKFLTDHDLKENTQLIFLHAGSGGSANNLSLAQYAQLASELDTGNSYCFVLTAGPGETERARELSGMIKTVHHVIYESKKGLIPFAQHIAFASLFISGSTGTLHLAGALNVPTAAFYTRRRSATSLRWQTLNSPDKRLAFTPPEDAEAEDMSKVDISSAAKEIRGKFLTG